MKINFRVLLLGTALCGGLNVAAHAQTAALAAPQAPDAKITREIAIKNVPPSLIAWWLDPKNHPTPPLFQVPGRPQLAVADTESNLPAGVDRLVAIDARNVLLVFGTQAGARQIEEEVAFLDKPLRQVQIEAQWVQISREDEAALGINYGEANAGKPGVRVGFVRGDFQATLQSLIAQNKAKILTAPRVLAINNAPANLSSFSGAPAQVQFRNKSDAFGGVFEGQTQIGVQYGLTVAPTINNDDAVRMLMSTSAQLKLATQNGTELVASQNAPGLETIVNVRDGDTVALSGQSSPLPDAAGKSTLVFVTASIVRRAGEGKEPVIQTVDGKQVVSFR